MKSMRQALCISILCIFISKLSANEEQVCTKEEPCDAVDTWSPFRYQSTEHWVDFKKLLKSFATWHNSTLYSTTIPCNEKKSLVFSPNAGLGDSIGGMTGAFVHAVRTGRMFFIDWKPNKWSVGLKDLPFLADFSKARKVKGADGKRLLCIDPHDAASITEGHLTSQHPVFAETVINNIDMGYDDLIKNLVRPSRKVRAILDNVPLPKDSHTTVVGMVIRTGEGEYNQFLSKGDELNFVKCFRNYVKAHRKAQSDAKFSVFVTSDVDAVKQSVVAELRDDVNVDVVTLKDSNVHMMHLEGGSNQDEAVKEKIRKTYAEFFLIGKCNVLFLTHGSLFGKTASEQGIAREEDVHYLSDSQCDGKREKYSYLKCAQPKYPKVCGFS